MFKYKKQTQSILSSFTFHLVELILTCNNKIFLHSLKKFFSAGKSNSLVPVTKMLLKIVIVVDIQKLYIFNIYNLLSLDICINP